MYHFVINFYVTIDGLNHDSGLIGSASSDNDYRPNYVKQTIQEQYRKRNPQAQNIGVVLQHVRPVTAEEYIHESGNFLRLL